MTTIAIVGAGIAGLSTGITLLEAGYKVRIYTKAITPNTTSDIAAAVWYPYKIQPEHRAIPWAVNSLKTFKKIAQTTLQAGILFKHHTELHTHKTSKPAWLEYLTSLPTPAYLLEQYKAHSYSVEIPIIDSSKYMPYLHQRFLSSGGEIKLTVIAAIQDLFVDHNIVINCSGLGAYTLMNDQSMFPIKGYTLAVEKIKDYADSLVFAEQELSHLFTRTEDCLLGGIAIEGDWDLSLQTAIKEDILARVREIYPRLGKVNILKERVGLRPGRTEVRLELEQMDTSHALVHNYGHGGAGYTVSWGCAAEAADLAIDFLKKE